MLDPSKLKDQTSMSFVMKVLEVKSDIEVYLNQIKDREKQLPRNCRKNRLQDELEDFEEEENNDPLADILVVNGKGASSKQIVQDERKETLPDSWINSLTNG